MILTHCTYWKNYGLINNPCFYQLFREFNRIALGSGLKIHCLRKCNATSNNFGLESSKRFGNIRYNGSKYITFFTIGNGFIKNCYCYCWAISHVANYHRCIDHHAKSSNPVFTSNKMPRNSSH